ncbi:MAG: hypothetical protein IPP01_12105 [Saprospiraceae bacterium]|nr:hypothetical protein [Saprospiraceae bacterium]
MLFESEIEKRVFTKHLWSDYCVGQELLLDQITGSKKLGRLPHCSLISARAGSSQLYVALSMAQTLFCSDENAPCGICEPCHKVSELMHPDLHFSVPVFGANQTSEENQMLWRAMVKSKPYLNISQWLDAQEKESKQANFTAAECRYIIDRLHLKPYESDKTIMIVWLPEYLGKEGNILLKLLEEPPQNSFLILVTEDISSIINTILSRAHLFRLKPISDKEFCDFFTSKDIPSTLAESECITSEKNLSIAYQNLIGKTKDGGEFKLDLIRSFFQRIYKGDPIEMIKWIDEFSGLSKENQRLFLNQFIQVLSMSIRSKISNSNAKSNVELIDFVQKLASILTLESIEEILHCAEENLFYLQRNASMKIVMTDMLIQCSKIIKNKN